MKLLALIIAQGDTLGILFHNVVWINGDFAATSGAVDHILGNGIAAGVAAQPLDNLNALVDTGAEV